MELLYKIQQLHFRFYQTAAEKTGFVTNFYLYFLHIVTKMRHADPVWIF